MATLNELDTPVIYADVKTVRHNIEKMQRLADAHGKKLRPHVKTHKLPLLAKWQIDAGAVGICVQKTSEAEIMAAHGVRNILISNEVIGRKKIDRVAALALLSDICLAVDSELGISQISDSAKNLGVEVGVFIDIDVGMERCGVRGEQAGRLAELVAKSPSLYLKGVMGYDGHTSRISGYEERRKEVYRSHGFLMEALRAIRSRGVTIDTVSVGGTPSASIWAELDGVTELQPGTYIYNDVHQVEVGAAEKSECALKIMATVMSKPAPDRAVIDAGSKSFAFDQGRFPVPMDELGIHLVSFSEEHGVLKSSGSPIGVEVGDKLSFIPYHACTAVDLWDEIYLVDGESVVSKLKIEARGARS
jgi:D-serine deaminase-like pyridoxal phosphate-dependent protein